jgi:hypothetical protein
MFREIPLFGICYLMLQRPQIPFRIKRRHAPASGSAYGLAVYFVLHIPAGKNSFNVCPG